MILEEKILEEKRIYEIGVEKGRQMELEKVLGIINDLSSIGYPYGADYKLAILKALKGEK